MVPSRWLVVICQGRLLIDFWNCGSLWYYHRSKSMTCGDLPRRTSYWLLKLCINDPIIVPSRWLVLIRQGGFLLDLIEMVDRWYYHRSKSLTCGDSPRRISPWLDKMVDRWSCYRFKSVARRNCVDLWYYSQSKSMIGVTRQRWLLELWIDDPIIRLSRWLLVIW